MSYNKILLVGQMGSGKDSVAEYIQRHYYYNTAKLGSYIRKHVDEMFPEIETSERRDHYQSYGEGMREIFGENIWCELLVKNYPAFMMQKVIITDARQPHEIKFFSEMGFQIIAVDTTDENRKLRLKYRDGDNFTESSFLHPTEVSARNIIEQIKSGELPGYIVDNNGILEYLKEQVDGILISMQLESKDKLI